MTKKEFKDLKRKIDDFLLLNILLPIIIFIYRLMAYTYDIKEINGAGLSPLQNKPTKYVYAFWHCQIIPNAFIYRNLKVGIVASQHKDGEIAARAVSAFGFVPVRGSTTRGGDNAIRGFVALMENGQDIAITPDGPRGPRETVIGNGIVYMAKLTGKPIIPFCNASDRAFYLRTWDKMIIPKPFAKVRVMFGEPVSVPPGITDSDYEVYRKKVENELLRINKECEAAVLNG